MARKMTEWPSKRGPITKIMPSDGCIGDTVPLAVGKWYDFHEFGWYMGNVGSHYGSSDNMALTREQNINLVAPARPPKGAVSGRFDVGGFHSQRRRLGLALSQ